MRSRSMTLCPDCRHAEEEEEKKRDETANKEIMASLRLNWLEDSGVPLRFQNCEFGNFKKELQPKAYAAALEYAKNTLSDWPETEEGAEPSLLLYSNSYGVGKTHLVAAIANYIIENTELTKPRPGYPCPVFFTYETQLMLRIRATYNRNADEGGETEEQVYKQLSRVNLLVLDDVGKEKPADPRFCQRVYFNLINERYNGCDPIVITSNLSPDALAGHIGDAAADRLAEMCKDHIFKLTGKSYRTPEKK